LESVQVKKSSPRIDAALLAERAAANGAPERTLLLGWNARAPIIIRELDNYAAAGSTLMVVAEGDGISESIEELRASLGRYSFEYRAADTTDRATLESISPECIEHIIGLCYTERMPVQKDDATTIVSLLILLVHEMKDGAHRYYRVR